MGKTTGESSRNGLRTWDVGNSAAHPIRVFLNSHFVYPCIQCWRVATLHWLSRYTGWPLNTVTRSMTCISFQNSHNEFTRWYLFINTVKNRLGWESFDVASSRMDDITKTARERLHGGPQLVLWDSITGSTERGLQGINGSVTCSAGVVLQDGPHAVIHCVQIWWVRRPFVLRDEESGKFTRHLSWDFFEVCAGAPSYWNVNFLLPKKLSAHGFTDDSRISST